MWELYAFWAFLPLALAAHSASTQGGGLNIALWSFLVIAAGAVGCAAGLYGIAGAFVAAFAGLLGSLAESVLGTVAERRGWLDNDMLNAVNTAIGAALAVLMVRFAA